AQDIRAATRILRSEQDLPEGTRFISIELREPPKEAVLAFPDGPEPDRAAFAVLRTGRETVEAVVSLTEQRVRSWQVVPGAQPCLTPEEFGECEQAVKADQRWREAMRRRGVQDLDLAIVDAWTIGRAGEQDDARHGRFVHALTFVRTGPCDNPYARPVEGLVARVDLDTMAVLAVWDEGAVPLPPHAGNYAADLLAKQENWPQATRTREDLKPIEITQPDGPSFTLDGTLLSWQKWQVRLGFTPREGLVLHQLGYHDRDRLRPILYRASLAEMFTPYADPGLVHRRKNAFDEGEYGAGFVVNSLVPGCDCLGEIVYADAVVNDEHGEPVTLKNAICLHEEDWGVGWKHTDFRTGRVETARARRLVISSWAVLGNYQYGYFWYLYLDGTIQFEIKLTGMISTGAVAPGEQPRYGALVAPGLYGPNHQHFFNVRLDMCVDGTENSVYEIDARPLPPGADNPFGNAWVAERTLLDRESRAQRVADPLVGRYWLVCNENRRNRLGGPVGYKLVPEASALPLPLEGTAARNRAAFSYRHLWVTRYAEGERYAAGDYPNQHPGGGGLPAYAAQDRELVGTDVVLWHTFGDHHVVRPEDWPVMPVTCVGFHLKPVGFFDGNPALDVPRPPTGCGGESRYQ
ncbi:primary-amine oxidase, partial [Crossiella equi]